MILIAIAYQYYAVQDNVHAVLHVSSHVFCIKLNVRGQPFIQKQTRLQVSYRFPTDVLTIQTGSQRDSNGGDNQPGSSPFRLTER